MKILVISPVSIIGEMIIKGIARGFKTLGADVLCYDIREINKKEVLAFKPDYVFGMDYLHFMDKEVEKFIESLNVPTIHYFIDNPKSEFAHSGNEDFFPKLDGKKNTIIYTWDEKYTDTFSQGAEYLSTGIDYELYSKDYPELDIAQSEILFAGRPLTDRRESIIAEVVKNFPEALSIYCFKKHFNQSAEAMKQKGFLNDSQIKDYKKCYKGFLRDEKELAAAYHRADVILNITLEQGLSSMNSRVLEALATGSLLITDYIEDTSKYFKENEELLMYKDTDELTSLLDKYLNSKKERDRIKGKALSKIEANHTLLSRAKIIYDKIKTAD